jgi:hypothetical protein
MRLTLLGIGAMKSVRFGRLDCLSSIDGGA